MDNIDIELYYLYLRQVIQIRKLNIYVGIIYG